MKIKNYITILFAVIAIIALLGLAGYMTYLNADDSNPFKQTVTNVVEELNLEFGLGLDLEKLSHPLGAPKKADASSAKPVAPAVQTEAQTEIQTEVQSEVPSEDPAAAESETAKAA